MRINQIIATVFALTFGMLSCNKNVQEQPVVSNEATSTASVVTKAYGDKSPIIAVYVETNDVNPLNAGDYYMNGEPFIDVVELFASNIHKETVDGVVRPTLYLNNCLVPFLENDAYLDYVVPLQEKGIKVLLTVLGDWAGLGLSNMTDTQAEQFASILAYAVDKYGLDGIGFDDEWSDVSYTVSGSFGNIIQKLRTKLGSDKLITVFQWGAYDQISSTQGAMIDYAYYGTISPYSYAPSSSISGVTTDRWSPKTVNLGNTYGTYALSVIQNHAALAHSNSLGALSFFNLRSKCETSPLAVFNAVAAGAWSSTVTMSTNVPSGVTAGCRPHPGCATDGYTITYDDTL